MNIKLCVLPTLQRTVRGGAVSKRGGWRPRGEMDREEEEEEGGWRTEMGGKAARKLGKLSGKIASCVCVSVALKMYSTGGERREGHTEKDRLSLSLSSQELNLSYQNLGDPFQRENFLRILRRLIRVEKLQLVDNSLTNLSSVRLPRYKPHYPDCTTTPPSLRFSRKMDST